MGTAGHRAPQRSGPWGKFLVLGASSHPDAVRRQEGARHAQAIIGLVDADRGSYRQLFAYESAVSLRPPEGAMRFAAGCIDGGLLWTCTPTEVVAFELASLRQVCSLSLPWFNDLHHVVRYRDGVLVAATGVDRVIHCDLAGGVRRIWHVLEGEGAIAPPDGRDYRMVVSTTPHLSHPNYVFVVDDAIWATRFEQRDAVCLTDSYRVLRSPLGGSFWERLRDPRQPWPRSALRGSSRSFCPRTSRTPVSRLGGWLPRVLSRPMTALHPASVMVSPWLEILGCKPRRPA